jgi:phosphoglycerol transferase MdoB-like AlkP superfamily enzyme
MISNGFMKFKFSSASGKATWQNNKPFIWFILSLLLIHSVLKIIFYNYNYYLLFTGGQSDVTGTEKLKLIKWSLGTDLLVILSINALLLFALFAARLIHSRISAWLILPVFVLVNSFAVLLNLVDIFYYPFHFQRANADLLYVLDHPLNRLIQQNIFIILSFFAVTAGIIYLVWVLHKKLFNSFSNGFINLLMAAFLVILVGFSLIFKNSFYKILVPTYPMIELNSNELPVVQNSFHTFLYSVFRSGGHLPAAKYMTDSECDSLMPIKKQLNINNIDSSKKNIVLFIMESVPYDFFDSSSPYKVAMPFFDSLLEKSSFYNNAFCYAHESNKGITAILAGIPTISDIPVYHSQYINMPITAIGNALHKLNYTSLFCIGDEYDNFGFAKCMNWLGIDNYYSKESIPGYKKLPAHSMGIQDEYVLRFFNQKINEQQKPFFAIHYNISTHYPYDIPASFNVKLPKHYTAPMKSMLYYDFSLQQFFRAAKNEPWFSNTVFIFCSDHWMYPYEISEVTSPYNPVKGYKIPIIIFDPAKNKKQIFYRPVSQLDIAGTILAYAGYRDSIISYGGNLPDSSSLKPFVFSKPNSTVYQVTDSSYVLGYNIISNKAEYLYNYKKDSELKENLVQKKMTEPVLFALTRQVQAFIQQTVKHFNGSQKK